MSFHGHSCQSFTDDNLHSAVKHKMRAVAGAEARVFRFYL